jgi:hypothetical protein
MAQIFLLLLFFVCLGLFATRFKGRAQLLLILGIATLLAYELYHLNRM